MRKYKKEELNIEDKIKDVLDEFDLTEGENFRYALDTIIGEVSDDEFSDLDIIEMVVKILKSTHWRCKMRKYKKEELNIEDKIKDVLDEFDLTEGENFRYALDTIIGEVSDDEFSDLDIIEMVVKILKSTHWRCKDE